MNINNLYIIALLGMGILTSHMHAGKNKSDRQTTKSLVHQIFRDVATSGVCGTIMGFSLAVIAETRKMENGSSMSGHEMRSVFKISSGIMSLVTFLLATKSGANIRNNTKIFIKSQKTKYSDFKNKYIKFGKTQPKNS